eukprot:3797431-Prymnesium_polylepis.1
MQHALGAHRPPVARSEPHGTRNIFKVQTGRQGASGCVNVKQVGCCTPTFPRCGAHSAPGSEATRA